MYLLDKFFNLVPLSPGDLKFISLENHEKYLVSVLFLFENHDPEKLKDLIIERALKNFRKFRSKLVFKFLGWYWEERPIEEALERIEIIKNNPNYKLDSYDDIMSYSKSTLRKKFDLMKEFPFKIDILHNNESPKYKTVMYFNYDHTLTDGISFVSFFITIADNYSKDFFPQGIAKKNNIINNYIGFIMIPFYVCYFFYKILFTYDNRKSGFIVSSKKENTGNTNIQISKNNEFGKISKICKSLGVTFNDMIVSIISSSCKKYCIENNLEVSSCYITGIPISNNKLTNSIDDIVFSNKSFTFKVKVDAIDDPIKECYKIQKVFKQDIKNIPFILLLKFLFESTIIFMPNYFLRYLSKNSCRDIDFEVSNIPASRKALYYKGSKVEEIIYFMTPGFNSSFISVASYNDKFRFFFNFDEALGIKIDQFKNIVDKEVDFVLNNAEVKDD